MYIQLTVFIFFLFGLVFVCMSLLLLISTVIFFCYVTWGFTEGDSLSTAVWYIVTTLQIISEVIRFFIAIYYSTQEYAPFSIRAWYPIPPVIIIAPLPATIVIFMASYLYGFYPKIITDNEVFIYLLGALLDIAFAYLVFHPVVGEYYHKKLQAKKRKRVNLKENKEPERIIIPFVHT